MQICSFILQPKKIHVSCSSYYRQKMSFIAQVAQSADRLYGTAYLEKAAHHDDSRSAKFLVNSNVTVDSSDRTTDRGYEFSRCECSPSCSLCSDSSCCGFSSNPKVKFLQQIPLSNVYAPAHVRPGRKPAYRLYLARWEQPKDLVPHWPHHYLATLDK